MLVYVGGNQGKKTTYGRQIKDGKVNFVEKFVMNIYSVIYKVVGICLDLYVRAGVGEESYYSSPDFQPD